MSSSEIATIAPQQSLVSRVATRFGVDPTKMLTTLKATAFRQRKQEVEITNEQMMALLVVADQYGLNPWTKEIYAFEDKGAIIPVVSVDGWSRIINDHPAMDGIEFRYSDEVSTPNGGKSCPIWCEAIFYRKDRSKPVVVREYLDEVYVPPRGGYSGPWQSHTKRMLRHKTFIQGSRVAIGFGGIYDEDEAARIIDSTARDVTHEKTTNPDIVKLETQLRERAKDMAKPIAPDSDKKATSGKTSQAENNSEAENDPVSETVTGEQETGTAEAPKADGDMFGSVE